jgi:ATP-dependent protease HslVU (ClpYQ) peptidase subunit
LHQEAEAVTTIAYKDGVMACDGRWSCNDMIDTRQTKVRRLKSGALLGSAGDNDSREIEALFQNVKIASKLPTRTQLMAIRCDYMGILVLPRGGVFKVAATHLSEAHWGSDFDEDVSAPFAACGSGKEFAIGAMAAGKSPLEAVKIASQYDINSGPPYYQYELKPVKRSKP